MLQTNQLMDFNYIWSKDLEGWTPIYQVDDFRKDKIRLLIQTNSAVTRTAFQQRQNTRIEKQLPVVGHNGQHFFSGKIVSISAAGALCVFNIPMIQVDDKIKMQVKVATPSGSTNSFNLEATVVRKLFAKTRLTANTELTYIIKFNELQEHGLKQIQKWCEQAA